MKRVKSCYLVLTLLVVLSINAAGKAATFQLILEDVSLESLTPGTNTNLTAPLPSINRSKYVSLNPALTGEMEISTRDNIILNLFSDTTYIAHIEKVSSNNNTITINGSIESHTYSDLLICKTGDQLFISINIPDEDKQYIIRSDAGTGTYILMEMSSSQMTSRDGPAILSGNQVSLNEILSANTESETDPLEPVSIDIMIVYTSAALEDAGFFFGGIENYIAFLMNEANTALANSNVYVTFNLVHSAMVDYVENKIEYQPDPILGDITNGSLYAALRHLSEKDVYMEDVLEWRDQYGADLVTLLVSQRVLLNNGSIAGLANQLTNPAGNPNDAFSVIVTRYSNYTFIHEIGHNMGCGHSKYQSTYNYGGLFDYSYGWRWENNCSIMAYPEGIYTRIGLFSNPYISKNGSSAGDFEEANNALTIRQTKHAIAAYRAHVDINDVNVPEYTPVTIYVDSNAPSDGNGLSWADAYSSLHDALLTAAEGDEIWVAAGTYTPTENDDRAKSFILKKGVSLYGGFNGTETKREQRNWKQNKTILSGNIGTVEKNKDNSYRIILGTGNTILDGFTITQSFGDSSFYSNSGYGGGIYFDDANDITIANCIFDENYSITGSGIYLNDCNLVSIENCTFMNNSAKNKGTVTAYNSDLFIKYCEFIGNSSNYSGGAIQLHNCDANIANSLFINNSAQYGGGAEIWNSNAAISNCTFSGNFANFEGGALESYGNTIVTNSIFWQNSMNGVAGNLTINYSDIQGGWFGTGKGNINIDPLFANPDSNDYHLKSSTGRWDSLTNAWIKENVTSSCIDAGDPKSSLSDELWPHGKRINMGAYGGTTQASMSLSNAGDTRDLDNDDLITWDDVVLLAEKWDCNDVPLKEDLDRNGIIDSNDLMFFYGNWTNDSDNTPPVLDPIVDQYINTGDELNFSVSATDNDGDELIYHALGLPEGAEFSEHTFTWTPGKAGTYLVTFIVSDYKSMDYISVRIVVEEK